MKEVVCVEGKEGRWDCGGVGRGIEVIWVYTQYLMEGMGMGNATDSSPLSNHNLLRAFLPLSTCY